MAQAKKLAALEIVALATAKGYTVTLGDVLAMDGKYTKKEVERAIDALMSVSSSASGSGVGKSSADSSAEEVADKKVSGKKVGGKKKATKKRLTKEEFDEAIKVRIALAAEGRYKETGYYQVSKKLRDEAVESIAKAILNGSRKLPKTLWKEYMTCGCIAVAGKPSKKA